QIATELAELRVLRADLSGTDWMADLRVGHLVESVRRRHWAGRDSVAAGGLVEVDEVRRWLGADTALVYYIFSPLGLVAVVVAESGIGVVEIPEIEAIRAELPGLRSDLDVAASLPDGPMVAVVGRSLNA